MITNDPINSWTWSPKSTMKSTLKEAHKICTSLSNKGKGNEIYILLLIFNIFWWGTLKPHTFLIIYQFCLFLFGLKIILHIDFNL